MDLQDVVDELAGAIGAPVMVRDREARPRAWDALTGAVRAETGDRGLEVPLIAAGDKLGSLWLVTDERRPLTASQYALIEAAAELARDLLARPAGRLDSTRRDVLPRLLSSVAAERRTAFAEAVARRWIDTAAPVVVWAVDVASGPGPLDRHALGRYLGSSRSTGLAFIAEQDGTLFFIGRHDEQLATQIRNEARRRSMRVTGIGTARVARESGDAAPAAAEAARAAEIVRWLPAMGGSADISQLGLWTLLESIADDMSQVARFSPAAVRLCAPGNDLQRETVEAYLDACGRVRDACERLHIHRTTLYYRLENLPAEVRAALDDGMSRSALHLCLKLLRYWEASGRSRPAA